MPKLRFDFNNDVIENAKLSPKLKPKNLPDNLKTSFKEITEKPSAKMSQMSMKECVKNIGNASSENYLDIAKISPSSTQTTKQAVDNFKQNEDTKFNNNLLGIKRLNQSVVVVESGKTSENPTNQPNYASLDGWNDKLKKGQSIFNAHIDDDIALRKPDQFKTIDAKPNLFR